MGAFRRPDAGAASCRTRLLLVEDDTRLANFVHRGLVQEGSSVDVSVDGRDAFHLALHDQEKKLQGHLDTNAVNLQDVLVELTDQMTPLAYGKAVHLQRGPICPAVVRGSKALIVEAVLNLAHNALGGTGVLLRAPGSARRDAHDRSRRAIRAL